MPMSAEVRQVVAGTGLAARCRRMLACVLAVAFLGIPATPAAACEGVAPLYG